MSTLLARIFGRRSRSSSMPGSSLQLIENDWKNAFQDAAVLTNAPRELEEAQNRMTSNLGRVYTIYKQLGKNYDALLLDVIRMANFCEELEPQKEIQAIHTKLLNLLAERDVVPWSPQIGEPAPAGCKILDVTASTDLPPGVVHEVVKQGFHKSGIVLHQCQVIVTTAPTKNALEDNTDTDGKHLSTVIPEDEKPAPNAYIFDSQINEQDKENEQTNNRD